MKTWTGVLAALCLLTALRSHANEVQFEMAIAEARFVTLGGIEQWVTIRSRDRKAPVLLWLHGGPADIQSPLLTVYEPWTDDFTLVQWDQRGAGKTFQRNAGPAQEVSLERIVEDGIELTEHLQRHLSISKVIIAGHSWGSLVAMHMVRKRPDLFAALVGAGQVTSWRDTVKWQYDYTLQQAAAANDSDVVAELEKAGLPPHDDLPKYFAMRRRLARYFPAVDMAWLERQQRLYASAPGATPQDLKSYAAGGAFSMPGLMPSVIATDLVSQVAEVPVRYCVIQGDEDTFTPTALARTFFDAIQAPTKYYGLIRDAGHFAPMTHAQEFLQELGRCLTK